MGGCWAAEDGGQGGEGLGDARQASGGWGQEQDAGPAEWQGTDCRRLQMLADDPPALLLIGSSRLDQVRWSG